MRNITAAAFALLLAAQPAFAQEPAAPAPVPAAAPASEALIETAATHAFLIDLSGPSVLFAKNADEKMPTSSMSKTMTLYLVFDALKAGRLRLDDEFSVSERAWKEGGAASGGSSMFLPVGSKAKVEDLIRGVAIQSGNDATIVLAEGLAGSEETFAANMNEQARKLGMTNSHFMNASGLPVEGHYSTPRDLATLALHLLTDFPEYYHYFGEKEFIYNKIRQQNRDPLLGKVQGADGIKTGHTDIAGYGLIGSAQRGDRRLILVINGLKTDKDRASEGAKLMEWGFRNFESRKLYAAGDAVGSAAVWQGKQAEVPLVAAHDVAVTLPVSKRGDVKADVVYQGPISAPIKKGAVIGKLRLSIPGQPVDEIDLVAGADVERAGLFSRVGSRLHYLLYGL